MELPPIPQYLVGRAGSYLLNVHNENENGILMNKAIIITKIPSFGREPNHKALKKSHYIGEMGGIRSICTKWYIF